MVTNKQTNRQTERQTNAGKNIITRFRGDNQWNECMFKSRHKCSTSACLSYLLNWEMYFDYCVPTFWQIKYIKKERKWLCLYTECSDGICTMPIFSTYNCVTTLLALWNFPMFLWHFTVLLPVKHYSHHAGIIVSVTCISYKSEHILQKCSWQFHEHNYP